MMPMVCDILKFEYFYTPGTIIVCDGRSANAKFLFDHFKRKWRYFNDKKKKIAEKVKLIFDKKYNRKITTNISEQKNY